jgi:DNA-binding transcriptional regulator YdaS (Cro superfamily)
MMRKLKARLALLGIRQNAMARELGIEVTRLNRIINGWVRGTSDETKKIRAYAQGGGTPGTNTTLAYPHPLHQQGVGE